MILVLTLAFLWEVVKIILILVGACYFAIDWWCGE